ncbi:MAG TPA: single-stranded DNA-binding protein [Firmicutes bacterium]|jgi:single-strand binding protein|nr:single-stranded DNA-binding protein [Clostridium sp. CAG:288]HAR48139.1 single-stranded DNA-binding protein [Bacillota bacterium]HAW99950.1 single-stranded DNA-binding protein [Bacillota bacterium]
MLNRVVIVGRLVRDPELRKTASDRSVVAFTVALDNRTTNNGEKSTSYIPCTAWNSTAESIAKFMKKGSLVGVDGHLNQRSYTANDGRKVSVVEVIADSVQFLEKKNDSSVNSSTTSNNDYNRQMPEDEPVEGIDASDDDLPF